MAIHYGHAMAMIALKYTFVMNWLWHPLRWFQNYLYLGYNIQDLSKAIIDLEKGIGVKAEEASVFDPRAVHQSNTAFIFSVSTPCCVI